MVYGSEQYGLINMRYVKLLLIENISREYLICIKWMNMLSGKSSVADARVDFVKRCCQIGMYRSSIHLL